MAIVRLKDRVTGGSIVADDDDNEFDNIITELNAHTAASNPHTGSLAKATDSITGTHSFGANGLFNNMKIKSHSNYTSSESYAFTYAGTTADATEASLTTWTLTDLYHYFFDAWIVCYDGSGTDYAAYKLSYSAYRAGGNATEAMGNIIHGQHESTGTMGCWFDCSGTTVRLRIVGKAATNLYWVANVAYQAVKTNT